jgi:hybrid cluster-associated redox disulfide protein
MTTPITKDMTFHQVMRLSPEVLKVLAQFQLGCVGCMGAQRETIEKGAMAHGLDVDELLEALNAVFNE